MFDKLIKYQLVQHVKTAPERMLFEHEVNAPIQLYVMGKINTMIRHKTQT